jgi:5-methylcytosine-specific restriction endonuclease McrA
MCGALVLPPRTRFCSNSCGERHRKTQRRAKKRAVYLEDVTLAALRARDGDNCGICGESIDFSVEYPDKMCPTIDHVVPIVAGGMHEMSNCQIAHFICNSRKGGRVA